MASQVCLSIFLVFFLQLHFTYALQSNVRFKIDLNNFGGALRRGDKTKLVHELKKRLVYLDYLDPSTLGDENNFDQNLEYAIKKYQQFYGLKVTGIVDINTITSICKHRYGAPDFLSPQTYVKSLYTFYEGNPRWEKTILYYHLDGSVRREHRPPIARAFREWQSVTPFMFPRVEDPLRENVDITVSFETGDHGDGYPFYPNGPMAHSVRPPYGTIHFNDEQRWASDGDTAAYDIKTIAMHEIGHVLGLDHSTDPLALMFPTINFGERKRIYRDDIDGIEALYGF